MLTFFYAPIIIVTCIFSLYLKFSSQILSQHCKQYYQHFKIWWGFSSISYLAEDVIV